MLVLTDTDALAGYCAAQRSADFVTVDTEFVRDTTYWPKLCLIQIAGPDEPAIIDPLAPGMDLTPLLDLFADTQVLKVFHAARQDLEIFYHLCGRLPSPVFDTQVAAMVCGFGEQASYEKLAGALANARIDKSARFTDWARRPLGRRELDYALSDVTHLRTVYAKLRSRLERNGRAEWLSEEMATLTNPATYDLDPENAWKRLKSRSRDRRYLAAVKALAGWREREAQRRDVPRNRVIRDEQLYDLAAQLPTTPDALGRTRGLNADVARGRIGKEILAEIEAVLALPKDSLPQAPKVDNAEAPQALLDLLKVLLKHKCEEHDIAQKLVANSADLEQIALDDHAEVAALTGWRRKIFGKDALALKRGDLALAAAGQRVKLVPLTAGGAEPKS
ncbi:ribonuclease D [Aquibaculum sediminis]|uniref:ribonuclease D n=1 Tax=Aquibaculum sediminis TaxID=3231907 RepID=UPI003454AFD0